MERIQSELHGIQNSNCIELEHMIFVRFHCLVLMIKDIY